MLVVVMGLVENITAAFLSNQHRATTALLPLETTVPDEQGLFSFGVPWPWFVEDTPRRLSNAISAVEVRAPRTEGVAAVLIQTFPDRTDLTTLDVSAAARQLAQQVGGRAGKQRRLLISGLPAVDLSAATATTHFRRILVPDDEITINIEAQFPASAAGGYLEHLNTMLATWTWH